MGVGILVPAPTEERASKERDFGSNLGSVPEQSKRIHYLDNLRAIAMLLGVFLHSALAYAAPAQSVWLATDPKSSVIVDASIWFIHLFRMGLFYLLSGYFAKWIVARKGVRYFFWNRCLRIVVPFVLFYPFLIAGMTVVIIFASTYLAEPRGLMEVLLSAVRDEGSPAARAAPRTMHLWFLYYLMAFNTLAVIAVGCKATITRWLRHLPNWMWIYPTVMVSGAMAGGTPLPAPESFIPMWWPFAFYGVFYVAGWQLVGRESWLDTLSPYVGWVAALSVALFVPYYILMPVLDLKTILKATDAQGMGVRFIEACLTSILSVSLALVALLLGKRYLSRRSVALSFVADSSYWVYLIHLPIVIFLQTVLVPASIDVVFKLCLVLLGTLVPCWASYLVFVRYTPLGWLLHGKRAFP